MDNNLPAELRQRLKELQAVFHLQLPGEIGKIRHTWQQLSQQWDTSQLTLLHRMCHSLAGGSSTFGAHQVGGAARALEQRLKPLLADSAPPSEQLRVEIEELLKGLAQRAAEWRP